MSPQIADRAIDARGEGPICLTKVTIVCCWKEVERIRNQQLGFRIDRLVFISYSYDV